ncbi:thiol peroxidase [Microbulbifer sp.]|uniref:thiol peroxidase n=1 Tax=Microbulbifer sp. TaxID=1908541 RepID=UPI002F9395D7
MANITLKGNPITTVGDLPAVGSQAPAFTLVQGDLSELNLSDLAGKRVVLNIFPSVDTPTCAMSVRTFNEKVASLENAVVVCVSADLPFAMTRFCGAEGIANVKLGSTFRSSFGSDYGVAFATGPLKGLMSRAVVVIDENGKVAYTEQVAEVASEPDYEAALAAL